MALQKIINSVDSVLVGLNKLNDNVDETPVGLNISGGNLELVAFDGSVLDTVALPASGLTSAANGLNALGSTVELGGTLNKNTTLNTGAFNFFIQDGTIRPFHHDATANITSIGNPINNPHLQINHNTSALNASVVSANIDTNTFTAGIPASAYLSVDDISNSALLKNGTGDEIELTNGVTITTSNDAISLNSISGGTNQRIQLDNVNNRLVFLVEDTVGGVSNEMLMGDNGYNFTTSLIIPSVNQMGSVGFRYDENTNNYLPGVQNLGQKLFSYAYSSGNPVITNTNLLGFDTHQGNFISHNSKETNDISAPYFLQGNMVNSNIGDTIVIKVTGEMSTPDTMDFNLRMIDELGAPVALLFQFPITTLTSLTPRWKVTLTTEYDSFNLFVTCELEYFDNTSGETERFVKQSNIAASAQFRGVELEYGSITGSNVFSATIETKTTGVNY